MIKPCYETDLCECGCEETPRPGNRFVNGHNSRLKKSKAHKIKIGLAQKRAWATKRIKPEVTYKGKFCRYCRNVFFVPLVKKENQFCSIHCFKKYWSITHTGTKNHMHGICGELAPGWKGGTSFEPYPVNFNTNHKNNIREIDENICQLCDKAEKQNGQKLDVHHINYDKQNISEENLISLCKSCHMKTNFNRKCWQNLFSVRLNAA